MVREAMDGYKKVDDISLFENASKNIPISVEKLAAITLGETVASTVGFWSQTVRKNEYKVPPQGELDPRMFDGDKLPPEFGRPPEKVKNQIKKEISEKVTEEVSTAIEESIKKAIEENPSDTGLEEQLKRIAPQLKNEINSTLNQVVRSEVANDFLEFLSFLVQAYLNQEYQDKDRDILTNEEMREDAKRRENAPEAEMNVYRVDEDDLGFPPRDGKSFEDEYKSESWHNILRDYENVSKERGSVTTGSHSNLFGTKYGGNLHGKKKKETREDSE